MPRYFFNIHDGIDVPDEDGTELPDIYRAQTEAIKLCGALVAEMGAKFWNHGTWRLDVCDDQQTQLFSLTLTAAEHDFKRSATS